MSERRTNATDGGYLPTVTATTAKQGFRSMAGGSSQGIPLLAMAALTWPTPTVWVQGETVESWFARKAKNKAKGYNGNGQGTPYRGAALAKQQAKRSKPLRDAISAPAGGKLNPLWVEWLMGWPLGHTEIGPDESAALATAKSRSRRQSRGACSEDHECA